MREGFGIARAQVPLTDRVRLLEALSDTGLKRITVGAFVSPRYVPQMHDFEQLLQSFQPRPGVQYLTFMHNQKARQKAQAFSPPLTIEPEVVTLFQDICDVHQRRNVNRSIQEAMDGWGAMIADAQSRGVRRARAGIASAWDQIFWVLSAVPTAFGRLSSK